MPSDPAVEQALIAFEAQTGLQVVVHDLAAGFGLPPARGQHRGACCQIVKRSADGWRCYDLEVTALRREWRAWPAGRVHRCHAGFIEWAVPIAWQDRLLAVCFAGQGRDAHLPCDLEQEASAAHGSPGIRSGHPVADQAELRRLLELLRQLAARLLLWYLQPADRRGDRLQSGDRRSAIDAFIHEHHDRPQLQLADLAEHLGLSVGRTAHLLRATTGRTFVQLVTAARLRRACDLLEHTGQPVHEVATRSGFGDHGHFHRVFKRHLGCTPRHYRLARG